MRKKLESFYENELYYIRSLATEFARQRPKIADRLVVDQETGRSEDPHVERLIEAFAFLTARTRLKLEDEFPELSEALLNVLYPHYLAPIPSMGMVQFHPDPEQGEISEGYTIPRHTNLYSRKVGGLSCRFRTAYPVTLWPMQVTAARYQTAPFGEGVKLPSGAQDTEALIRIELRTLAGVSFDDLDLRQLRFFLSGDDATVHRLYELALNRATHVVLQPRRGEERLPRRVLSADAVQPVGFDRDEALLPYPNHSFPGYRLMTEYFTFPQKFLFLDVTGLDSLPAGDAANRLEVLLLLETAETELETRVEAETFRLGCSPVVNLFKQQADPVRLTHTKTEHRVVPDVRYPNRMEVYSVDAVETTDANTGEGVEYSPFFGCRHGRELDGSEAYWHTMRRPSLNPNDPGTDVFLSLVDMSFNPKRPPAEVLNVETTCTNRDLPGELRTAGGEAWGFQLEGQAPIRRIDPVVAPTPSHRLPADESRWRLISHLSLNHLSITDAEFGADALREILKLYDYADTRASAQHIAGILRVATRRKTGRIGGGSAGGFGRGLEITVELDPDKYTGGGMYLFASVLDRFLALYASMNSFTELVTKLPGREDPLKRWPRRAGEQTLI